jgi:hypothetical protein
MPYPFADVRWTQARPRNAWFDDEASDGITQVCLRNSGLTFFGTLFVR